MDTEHQAFFRFGYVAMAAAAGAITALTFTRWRTLSVAEIVLTLIGGFSFAIFVTPWAAEQFFGIEDDNVRAIAAMTYLFGVGSNVLLPMIIRWIGRVLGSGDPKDE